MRDAEVRFYVDADLLGLAKVVSSIRPDITYPGDLGATIHRRRRPPCLIASPATRDTEWLPMVAAQGWLVISRDHRIRENYAERHAVRDNGVKMVALAGSDAGTKWEQLKLLMQRWERIELLQAEPGPFIYLASRTRMASLNLDD